MDVVSGGVASLKGVSLNCTLVIFSFLEPEVSGTYRRLPCWIIRGRAQSLVRRICVAIGSTIPSKGRDGKIAKHVSKSRDFKGRSTPEWTRT
jgi:hypothetical protein